MRVFHWSLAVAFTAACVSAKGEGETALRAHFLSGYAVCALLGFRLCWGFAGDRNSRFARFLTGPRAAYGYLRGLLRGEAPSFAAWPGHSPLGGWAVVALLGLCSLQGLTGLFTADEIESEGPLARFVSQSAVHASSRLHAWGEYALYLFVALHLAALVVYAALGRRLVPAMVSGMAQGAGEDAVDTEDDSATRLRALILLALCAGLMLAIATL